MTAESTQLAAEEAEPESQPAPEAAQGSLDPEERARKAQVIIRRNVLWAVGLGILPLPLVDILGVTGIQIAMLKELSNLYGVAFSHDAAKKVIGSLLSAVGGVSVGAMVATSLLKLVPPIGASLAILAGPTAIGAFTYATGKVFMMHFETGGSFFNLDADALRAHFVEELAKAKTAVASIQEEERADTNERRSGP